MNKLLVTMIMAAILVGCQSQKPARKWLDVDSRYSADEGATDGWQANLARLQEQILSKLVSDSAVVIENIQDFRRVVAGWTEQNLPELFWAQVHNSFDVTAVPFQIELGSPDVTGYYVCRAIFTVGDQSYLVRTKPSQRPIPEYSPISEAEFREIMATLCDRFDLAGLRSDLGQDACSEPHMAIVRGACINGSCLALFSCYNAPSCPAARELFDFIDSLFWENEDGS